MAVVTVSRQYGAGGLRFAPALADALGFKLVGRDLVEEAARRIGLDPTAVEALDERAPAIVEEIGLALAQATPGFGPGFAMPHGPGLDDRALAEATRRVIESLAESGGYVILGRGSQAALAGRKDACHLALVADLADRARRIAGWQEIDEREATARCQTVDGDRARYVRHFYGRDIGDPLLYDCLINTSRLAVDDAIGVGQEAARAKFLSG